MLPINWTNLESSKIRRAKFEPNPHDDRGDVLIEFNEGKTYRFKDVPSFKVEKMVHSSSPGGYFNNHIQPYHKSTKEV
jgi:hypothetical protein